MKTKTVTFQGREGPLRVDLIDDRHADWPMVLASLNGSGRRSGLMLNGDWLSTRQSLLVARAGRDMAGHLCFHLKPSILYANTPTATRSPAVDAHLDALDVWPGFSENQVKQMLVSAAVARAKLLRCQRLVGFEVSEAS